MRVAIIGGGIAGLSAAWHLAAEPAVEEVTLLEREQVLAAHSSGHNAAIFRHLEAGAGAVALAQRARVLLDELAGPGWLDRRGGLYVAAEPHAPALDELLHLAHAHRVTHEVLRGAALVERAPMLRDSACAAGLWVPDDGVIDLHEVVTRLARGARARGARIRVGAEVTEIRFESEAIRGVTLVDGSVLAIDAVILASGAWAAGLGASVGAGLPLEPRRRHLALLDAPAPLAVGPVVWRVDEQIYARPETGGVLASPCDEMPWPPGMPPTDPEALVQLGERLQSFAPGLAESGVARAWSCLRTFAPDRDLVVGPDPRVRGLFWAAGLGGRGMTVGAAVGEVLAAEVAGRPHPLAEALAPARLLKA